MNLILIAIGFLTFVGIMWLVAAKLGMLKPTGEGEGGATAVDDGEAPVPYVARERLLSPAEASFHSVLQQALPILTAEAGKDRPPLLFAKVRLVDVLAVSDAATKVPGDAGTSRGGRGERQSAQNRIDRKHVDFVLCDPAKTRPLLVIELDDVTHQRAERRKRDEFVDRACAAASVPILHVKAAAAYQPRVVAAEMAKAMKVGSDARVRG